MFYKEGLTMGKAEQFISDCTKNCNNALLYDGKEVVGYEPWLTPDQARKAVVIAKEEILEKVVKWIDDNFYLYEGISSYYVTKELKQAMKDE